ncbi:MAG TPA: FAD-dependent oxidoreductase [Gemmatimonadaceae bacterium]
MAGPGPSRKTSLDVVIVGGGVVGLSIALVASRRGIRVRVIDAGRPGAASAVAAGLLAPSLGKLSRDAAAAFIDARDRYEDFLELVRGASGQRVTAGQGILEVSLDEADHPLNEAGDRDARRMSPADVRDQLPDLAAVRDAVMHPKDRWIEPAGLIKALRSSLPSDVIFDAVEEVELLGSNVRLLTEGGRWISCDAVVIASGVWTRGIKGFARMPIDPAKGETMVLETTHSLTHAIACGEAYVVPRPGAIVVGGTFELGNSDPTPTERGQATLANYASRLIPGALARASGRRAWAGVRPMTPDRLPVIDADPGDSRIVYACGHGKNGMLLAGLTAEIAVGLLWGNRLDPESPFRLSRLRHANLLSDFDKLF